MKNYIKIFILILLLIPITVNAEEISYTDAKKAVKEVMQAWYMRGSLRQYNSAKNTYSVLRHPEDDTTQERGYSVCSGFTNDVWMEAFGMQSKGSQKKPGSTKGTPSGSNDYNNHAENYLNEMGCVSSETKTGCNGEYLIFFASMDANGKATKTYYYKNKTSFKEFIKLLQPGDALAYDGHALMVYDIKKDANGTPVDALIINSTGGDTIQTKVNKGTQSTNTLFFTRYKRDKNNILDLSSNSSITQTRVEGTLKYLWLSSNTHFVKDNKIVCNFKGKRCSITRAYYKSGTKAAFNYKITWPNQIKTSLLRTKLPGIFIHKTSTKLDNSSVIRGNEITYTIKIINNSNLKLNGNEKATYPTFYLEENIPSYTTYKEKTYEEGIAGTYNSSTNSVKWTIKGLEPGKEKVLKFTVKVNSDYNIIGKTYEQTGKVYIDNSASIPTGTIKHEIIRTVTTPKEDYENCYAKQKKAGKTSLELVNETYKCVYGDDWKYDLTSLNASKLNKIIVDTKSGSKHSLDLNTNGSYKNYTNMILDSYWGGLYSTSSTVALPKWSDSPAVPGYIGGSKRAKTILEDHFKPGDILIYTYKEEPPHDKIKYTYTDELGIYAYIYIDKKFQGINYNGTKKQRNEFTQDYYGTNADTIKNKLYNNKLKDDDNPSSSSILEFVNNQTLFGKDRYVILRPEKVIKLIASLKVSTKPTKLEYVVGDKLDLTGGVITVTYNDGTTKTVAMTSSDVKVTGYDKTKTGEQELTVTYNKKTTTYKVTVKKKELTKIEVKTKPTKITYLVGESLNLTGGVIKATYNNNTTTDISMKNTNVTVTGFNKNTAGEQTLTVKYSSKTTTFKVQVNNIEITTLSIKSLPNKLEYTKGEDLDLTGGVLKKTYNNGTTKEVNMSDQTVTITGYNKNTVGTQTVQVETEGKRKTFEVVVNEPETPTTVKVLDSITISNLPKTDYLIGEQLNLTNGKVKAKYLETTGTETKTSYKILDMTSSNVSVTGFSSDRVGEKTVTVTYSEKTTTFTVNVTKKEVTVTKIEMKKLPKKLEYIQNKEELDITDGIIKVTKSDNSEEDLELSNEEIEILDFDNTKLGKQTITVLYKGSETNFEIEIVEEKPDETIKEIKIHHNPDKYIFVLNEDALDISGLELTIEYTDGTKEVIKLSEHPGEYIVSGYDNTKKGEQGITITYKGHIIKYKVKVIDPEEEDIVPIPDTKKTLPFILECLGLLMIIIGSIIVYKKINKKEIL